MNKVINGQMNRLSKEGEERGVERRKSTRGKRNGENEEGRRREGIRQ